MRNAFRPNSKLRQKGRPITIFRYQDYELDKEPICHRRDLQKGRPSFETYYLIIDGFLPETKDIEYRPQEGCSVVDGMLGACVCRKRGVVGQFLFAADLWQTSTNTSRTLGKDLRMRRRYPWPGNTENPFT